MLWNAGGFNRYNIERYGPRDFSADWFVLNLSLEPSGCDPSLGFYTYVASTQHYLTEIPNCKCTRRQHNKNQPSISMHKNMPLPHPSLLFPHPKISFLLPSLYKIQAHSPGPSRRSSIKQKKPPAENKTGRKYAKRQSGINGRLRAPRFGGSRLYSTRVYYSS